MPDNLEKYVNKVFKQAKNFLQKNFPEVYEDIQTTVTIKYELGRKNLDYDAAYDYNKNQVVIITYKKVENPKDKDIVLNGLNIRMTRKNSYLTSFIHELGETIYLKELMNRKMIVTYYDIDISHNAAVSLEMHALEKLIEQSEGEDKQDFIRRKKARIKDKKKYKLKGV